MRLLDADSRHTIRFQLNGKAVEGVAAPRMLATDFLREALGATGTHAGCEHGVCGACTIRLDGKAVRACLLYAVQLEGRNVQTVEGLAGHDEELSAMQTAFRKHHALQCGFCTPGILMSLSQLLEEEPGADEARIRDCLSGHICRCTGYHGIVAAALEVFEAHRRSGGESGRERTDV